MKGVHCNTSDLFICNSDMDVVGTAVCEESWVSCSAPSSLSPCRRAASFPFFGGDHSPFIASALKIRSQSESEGLNRFRHLQAGSMPIEQLRWRLQTQSEETSTDCELTSSDSDNSTCDDIEATPVRELCENSVSTDDTLSKEEAKIRKCVRFADDCGNDLFCVRVIAEPADSPPKVPSHVIKRHRGDSYCSDDEAETSTPISNWILQFKQPASDYMKFRHTVDEGKVALENVVLKNEISHMLGTIKVANISFEKKVFVRYTSNNWKTYLDVPATFQPSSSKIYDTFVFDIQIPRTTAKDSHLEFCVCYEANNQQYWDSNSGANFSLLSEGAPVQHKPHHTALFGHHRELDRNDAYCLEYDNWTKFASWKQLSTEGPYW